MFLWLKTLYRKRAVTWPFIFYTIIWTLSIFLFAKDMFIRSITNEELKNAEIEFLVVLSTIISDCTKDFYNYFFMEKSEEYPYEFILDVNRLVGVYYATDTLAHRYKINSTSLFSFLQSLKKFIDS